MVSARGSVMFAHTRHLKFVKLQIDVSTNSLSSQEHRLLTRAYSVKFEGLSSK